MIVIVQSSDSNNNKRIYTIYNVHSDGFYPVTLPPCFNLISGDPGQNGQ